MEVPEIPPDAFRARPTGPRAERILVSACLMGREVHNNGGAAWADITAVAQQNQWLGSHRRAIRHDSSIQACRNTINSLGALGES
ncbi:hypothetical protein ACQP25_33580 [Microtetraspora malaysiensis]|uniref:hypothetical protein n=1 Tax=Microtetraspora malaysiensis TaxID=161358 RepID=UPI003D9249F8